MAQQNYHHGDLRSALFEAAESLVEERGAHGWSLREVSARIGVSPSAAYHHFDSREALVHALSDRLVARLGERMAQAPKNAKGQKADPQSRLVAVSRSYVSWVMENPALAGLLFSARPGLSGGPISPHPHDVIATEFDRLVKVGALSSSARVGAEFLLWAAIHGLAGLLSDSLIRLPGKRAADRQTERLVRTLLAGLSQESTRSPSWPQPSSAHTELLAKLDSV